MEALLDLRNGMIDSIVMTSIFPEIIPSRDECLMALRNAIEADDARIYIDASLLIHCYEMNALASEDLLAAFELYTGKVGVPTWAAKETWEYADTRIARQPLKSSADKVKKELARFRKEAGRYIDDDSLADLSRDEYHRQLGNSFDAATEMIKKVESHQPKADLTTKRLLPFIENHLLASDLNGIIEIVSRTASTRMAHRIPPGFGDTQPADDIDDEGKSSRAKGKQKNPHGDLIIWLEILQDCRDLDAKHLVLITRDVTKGDWAFVPKKIRDENNRPQNNSGLVTLPQPLLIHEARKECPSLQSVHVVSIEMLTHVLRSLRIEVSNLTAALQSGETEDDVQEDVVPPAARQEADYVLKFDPADMAYEPDLENEIDSVIVDLQGEGWRVQNTATRRVETLLGVASRDQRVQIGRGIVAAANDGALNPIEFLSRVLSDKSGAAQVRSDILIGALAEIYVSETGDLKKPRAPQALVEIIFRHAGDADLAEAYRVVIQRLDPQSRKYLLLPTEGNESIDLEVLIANSVLGGVLHNSVPLIELDAPANRQMQRTGADQQMDMDELLTRLAEEFIVPKTSLKASPNALGAFVVPDNAGFVAWGPNTGTTLR